MKYRSRFRRHLGNFKRREKMKNDKIPGKDDVRECNDENKK